MPSTMRRIVDCVAAATALALVGGLGYYFYHRFEDDKRLDSVSAGLRRFEQVLALRGASKDAEVSERGWPITVDPEWFGADAPRNVLLTPDRPWLEVATPEQAALSNPPLRLAIGNGVPAFWYNPYQGVVRARVPIAISDRKALELYNRVNSTDLDTIYSADAAPQPAPPGETAEQAVPGGETQANAEPAEAPQP